MEYVIIYFGLCLLLAWGYNDTYMGFLSGLIISLIFTPIIGFIILLFVPSKSKKQKEQAKLLQAIADQNRSQVASTAEEIEKLASLKDKGHITEAEFQIQKTKLLS